MIARWLVVVTAVAGCGRIGYDAAPVDAQGDSAEAGPPPGALMACDQPVQLIDLGDTGGATATTFALDVAATATGFVAAWQTGGAQTHTSAGGAAISPRPCTTLGSPSVATVNSSSTPAPAWGTGAVLSSSGSRPSGNTVVMSSWQAASTSTIARA